MMSAPKGKAIQRELAKAEKEYFAPFGASCEIDFSKRGGHQQLIVTLINGDIHKIDLPSSPRNKGNCFDYLRQRCNRIIRGTQM